MKSTIFLALFLTGAASLFAQDLPVKTVTLFKNNRALIFKAGTVTAKAGKYSTTNLPEALFGTYWVSSPSDHVKSVFISLDSTQSTDRVFNLAGLLKENIGRKVILRLLNKEKEVLEGTIEQVSDLNAAGTYESRNNSTLVLHGNETWTSIKLWEINYVEFPEKPDMDRTNKKVQPRLDVNFNDNAGNQEIGLTYLRENIGWIPVYRLELLEKTAGRLTLRGDLINDGETLDAGAVRLGASVPNFAKASEPSGLMDIEELRNEDVRLSSMPSTYSYEKESLNAYRSTYAFSMPAAPEIRAVARYNTRSFIDDGSDEQNARRSALAQGAQSEDFYYYTIDVGKFPKGTRYQYPVFEEEVQLEHYYETWIGLAGASDYGSRKLSSNDNYLVQHYVEFDNKSKYPWTEGVVSILSKPQPMPEGKKPSESEKDLVKHGGDYQPISQTTLPYTSVDGKCQIAIARASDIEVTHLEGDVDRTLNAKKLFNEPYDLVKTEARLGIVNRSNETIKIKVKRRVNGKPLNSSEKWKITQEEVSLTTNDSYLVIWEFEIEPQGRRNWNYSYETYEESDE